MSYNKKTIKALISLSIIFLPIFFVSAFELISSSQNLEEKQANFSEELTKELNEKYKNSENNIEFMGYLKKSDDTFVDVTFFATKNLDTHEINITNSSAEQTNYSIHSHPNGICLPSERDKLSTENICIICGEDKIKCYENG